LNISIIDHKGENHQYYHDETHCTKYPNKVWCVLGQHATYYKKTNKIAKKLAWQGKSFLKVQFSHVLQVHHLLQIV